MGWPGVPAAISTDQTTAEPQRFWLPSRPTCPSTAEIIAQQARSPGRASACSSSTNRRGIALRGSAGCLLMSNPPRRNRSSIRAASRCRPLCSHASNNRLTRNYGRSRYSSTRESGASRVLAVGANSFGDERRSDLSWRASELGLEATLEVRQISKSRTRMQFR